MHVVPSCYHHVGEPVPVQLGLSEEPVSVSWFEGGHDELGANSRSGQLTDVRVPCLGGKVVTLDGGGSQVRHGSHSSHHVQTPACKGNKKREAC